MTCKYTLIATIFCLYLSGSALAEGDYDFDKRHEYYKSAQPPSDKDVLSFYQKNCEERIEYLIGHIDLWLGENSSSIAGSIETNVRRYFFATRSINNEFEKKSGEGIHADIVRLNNNYWLYTKCFRGRYKERPLKLD